ncbi:MAG: phosphatase PAP2 family protein [Alistipes sp.]|nr:phosphatase PAP2 family protein [Candidatus Alistipes equi]
MDIDYLLFIQNIRGYFGTSLDSLFMALSDVVNYAYVMIAVIYWGISKRFGTVLLFSFAYNRLANGMLKQTVCAYRPWVRSSAIHPVKAAVGPASGYSFPSGHTTNAVVMFGAPFTVKGIGIAAKFFCIFMIAIIAFSRNYLGVHTPQDVIFAIIVGALMVFLASKTVSYVEKHPSSDILVALFGVVLTLLCTLFIMTKGYPMDYGADGKLIVDPEPMKDDTLNFFSATIMVFIGWIVERRLIKFRMTGTTYRRLVRVCWGLLGYMIFQTVLVPILWNSLDVRLAIISISALRMLYIMVLFPLLIRIFEGKEA